MTKEYDGGIRRVRLFFMNVYLTCKLNKPRTLVQKSEKVSYCQMQDYQHQINIQHMTLNFITSSLYLKSERTKVLF